MESENPYNSPTTAGASQPPPTIHDGDATGGVIPYKNPKALIAYYLGIFSGLPLIGLPLGYVALVLGVWASEIEIETQPSRAACMRPSESGGGGFFALLWTGWWLWRFWEPFTANKPPTMSTPRIWFVAKMRLHQFGFAIHSWTIENWFLVFWI